MADFTAVILQCEKPLHLWSSAFKSSFAQSWNSYCEILESVRLSRTQYFTVNTKLESVRLSRTQYFTVNTKLSWNIHMSLSSCSAVAGIQQYITGLSIYCRDMACFDGLYLKKSHSEFWNIDISFGPYRAPLCAQWWSTLRTAWRSY